MVTVTNNTAPYGGSSTDISQITFTVAGSLGSSASALQFVEIAGTRINFSGTPATVDITGNPIVATKATPAGANPASPTTHWDYIPSGGSAQSFTVGGVGAQPWDLILPGER